ncbi:hypothetical protein Tco_1257063 [Tanacetum coccineum]
MVNLYADDEDDVEEQTRSNTHWTREEETLLAETWVEVFQNAEIRNDRSDEAFWNQIMEDFNTATKSCPRAKNMMTGKWTMINDDCQKFNAIYKHLQRKSGENEVDHIENAKTNFTERYDNRKFTFIHVWNVLKAYPKCDSAEPIDQDNLAELFGTDPRPRPAGKPRPAKKQNRWTLAKAAYEAKRKKELGSWSVMIDTDSLPPDKSA